MGKPWDSNASKDSVINYQVVTKINITVFILPLQMTLSSSKEMEIIEKDKVLSVK